MRITKRDGFHFIVNLKLHFVLTLNNIESFHKNMCMGSEEETRFSNYFVLPCSFFWTSIQTGTGRLLSLGKYLNVMITKGSFCGMIYQRERSAFLRVDDVQVRIVYCTKF